jgi:hypothetical protein
MFPLEVLLEVGKNLIPTSKTGVAGIRHLPQGGNGRGRERTPQRFLDLSLWRVIGNGRAFWNEAQFFHTFAKKRAEFDAKIGTGLMASSLPTLNSEHRNAETLRKILLPPVASNTFFPYPVLPRYRA